MTLRIQPTRPVFLSSTVLFLRKQWFCTSTVNNTVVCFQLQSMNTLSVSDSHCLMHLCQSATVQCVRCISSESVPVAFRILYSFLFQVSNKGN